MENMNIFKKMSLVTEKINRIAKNLKVGVGKNTYNAVGEADVLEAVKPAEIEFGIYSYPFSRKVIDTNVFITTKKYEGSTDEKTNLFLRIETVYRFVNMENTAEYIDITSFGDGVDTQDKAPGKAMTYSDKYALLKAYKIETGDDPDQRQSENMKLVSAPCSAPQKKAYEPPIAPKAAPLKGDANYVLKAGKYANEKLIDCPKEYLDWLITEPKTNPQIKANAQTAFDIIMENEGMKPAVFKDVPVVADDDLPF